MTISISCVVTLSHYYSNCQVQHVIDGIPCYRWSRRHRHGTQGSQRRDIIDYRTGYIRSHLRSPSGRVRWPDQSHTVVDLVLWVHHRTRHRILDLKVFRYSNINSSTTSFACILNSVNTQGLLSASFSNIARSPFKEALHRMDTDDYQRNVFTETRMNGLIGSTAIGLMFLF